MALPLASLLANMRIPEGVQPVLVRLPTPPALTGALAPNYVLANAVRFADGQVTGPESLVLKNGMLYTGQGNGYVSSVTPQGAVKNIRRMSLNTCGLQGAPQGACGRPLGMRSFGNYLVVADAYHGIILLDPKTTDFSVLVSGRQMVNGKRLGGFINDLVISKTGTVYFTSSSTRYTRDEYYKVFLEGETSGRVLMYNKNFLGQVKVRELVTRLSFPNGLELSKEEDYLLISEAGRARIHKAYLGKPPAGRKPIEVFSSNLPGAVDNIRLSPRGTYWVGISEVRHKDRPSMLDTYGNDTKVRGAIIGLPKSIVIQRAYKYGLAIELNNKGQIIRSLHDPKAALYDSVSEVQELGNVLYIASFNRPFIGLVRVADLPPITNPDGGSESDFKKELATYLASLKERLKNVPQAQVRYIVLALMPPLVQSRLDLIKATTRVKALEKEIQALQDQINGRSTPSSLSTTKTPDSTSSGVGTTAMMTPASTTASVTTAGTTPAASTAASTAALTTGGSTSGGGSTVAATTATSATATATAASTAAATAASTAAATAATTGAAATGSSTATAATTGGTTDAATTKAASTAPTK